MFNPVTRSLFSPTVDLGLNSLTLMAPSLERELVIDFFS
jgi:hypothetical protein